MQSLRTKKIIKELAYEFNISEREVTAIVMAPFNLVVKIMRAGVRETLDFPSIRIISFGIFYMSNKRREYFKNLNERLSERRAQEVLRGDDRLDNQGDTSTGDASE